MKERKKRNKKDKVKEEETSAEAVMDTSTKNKKKKDKELSADTTADSTMDTSAMDTSDGEGGKKKKADSD